MRWLARYSEESQGRTGRFARSCRRGLPADAFQVLLHAPKVLVWAVGIWIVEEAVKPKEIAVDFGQDVFLPEERSAALQILRALKSGEARRLLAAPSRGFDELQVKDRQLVHVVARGHLPENVRGGQRETERAFQFNLERNRSQVGVDTR